MAIDTRSKDVSWLLNVNANGKVPTLDAQLAVLMDIRDEMKRLNEVLHCHNFLNMPSKLERIARNTSKPKRRKARAK